MSAVTFGYILILVKIETEFCSACLKNLFVLGLDKSLILIGVNSHLNGTEFTNTQLAAYIHKEHEPLKFVITHLSNNND